MSPVEAVVVWAMIDMTEQQIGISCALLTPLRLSQYRDVLWARGKKKRKKLKHCKEFSLSKFRLFLQIQVKV